MSIALQRYNAVGFANTFVINYLPIVEDFVYNDYSITIAVNNKLKNNKL